MSHMEEESLKNFTNSVIFLVKLFSGLKDKFLAQKLYDKISGFIASFIRLAGPREESDIIVSHNINYLELKNCINGLLELLDYLEHSKLVSTTPLLYARRNLLDFKLGILKLYHRPVQPVSKPKEVRQTNAVPKINHPKSLKERSNKERIFNFIKHSPSSRTKEIIHEFSILSERTVKRNLKELATEGLIRKWSKDKGVYYSAV